jgi:hypothetical protein
MPKTTLGSSGRRFKSSQPDAGQRLYLAMLNGDFRHRTQMKYPNELSADTRQLTSEQQSR